MSRYRCESCHGEYDDPGPNGMAYYHVCPPVTMVTVIDDQDAEREIPLRGLAGIELAESAADRTDRIARGARPDQVYIERRRREAPRRNARDETPLRYSSGPDGRAAITAEGAGRTEIPARPVIEEPVDDAL